MRRPCPGLSGVQAVAGLGVAGTVSQSSLADRPTTVTDSVSDAGRPGARKRRPTAILPSTARTSCRRSAQHRGPHSVTRIGQETQLRFREAQKGTGTKSEEGCQTGRAPRAATRPYRSGYRRGRSRWVQRGENGVMWMLRAVFGSRIGRMPACRIIGTSSWMMGPITFVSILTAMNFYSARPRPKLRWRFL